MEMKEAMLNIFNSMVESTGFDVIKLYESSVEQLNKITNNKKLYIGQKIML